MNIELNGLYSLRLGELRVHDVIRIYIIQIFDVILRLEAIATLLVVMSNFLLSDQIKSMDISDFTLFKSLLMLKTWMFIFAITLSELFDLIGMITYFFERLFVIILSLGVFPVQITNDFVYFRNLVSRKLWKYIFDFYNVKDIIL